MKKILFLVSRIENILDSNSSKGNKMFNLIKVLSKEYSIDILYFQSLNLDEKTISELKNYIGNIFNFKELKLVSREGYNPELKYEFLSKNNYDIVFYSSYYLLKNTLAYVLRYFKDSFLVLDVNYLDCLYKKKLLNKTKDFFLVSNIKFDLKTSEFQELFILTNLDLILVKDKDYKKFLDENLINVKIEFIEETKLDFIFKIFQEMEKNKKSKLEISDIDFSSMKNVKKRDIVLSNYEHKNDTFRISFLDENSNSVKNYNAEIINAIGDKIKYLLLLPFDSIILKESVERMLFLVLSYINTGIVFSTNNREIDIKKHLRNIIKSEEELRGFWKNHFIKNIGYSEKNKYFFDKSFLVNLDVIERVGLLDERYETIECAIIDLCLKIYQYGMNVVKTNESFIYYKSISFDKNYEHKLRVDYKKLLNKWTFDTTKFLFSLK